MTIDMIVILIILLLCLLYVLSTMCRRGHSGVSALAQCDYAHRGLHGNGVPENSMRAFRRAAEAGYGIELDVHLLADGNLAVIHDSDLKRVTGEEGKIEDLTADKLSDYKLGGTFETIPDFRQVLQTVSGKVPLIIELKVADHNYPALCRTVCDVLEDYEGIYCLESFDPRCINWLRKNRPELIRGQLTENYFVTAGGKKLPWYLRTALKYQMLNFITRPDFVAYRFEHRRNISNWLVKKLWKAPLIGWTIKTNRQLTQAQEEGWIPIFENVLP